MAQQGNLPSQRQRSAPPDGALNLRTDAVKDITGSGDLLRSLMNNIPGIVYRGMPDWSLTFVGGEVERLTGYTCREMLGESTLWRSLIHPDDIGTRSASRSGMPFAARRGSCASSAGSFARMGKSGGSPTGAR